MPTLMPTAHIFGATVEATLDPESTCSSGSGMKIVASNWRRPRLLSLNQPAASRHSALSKFPEAVAIGLAEVGGGRTTGSGGSV